MRKLIVESACLALSGILLSPVVGAFASSAAEESVLFCGFDHEGWRRDHPRPAAKRPADLNAGQPRTVRLIYFLPNDRPFRQDVVDLMKFRIREAQSFFADEMHAHGYARRSFRIETDNRGDPLVHHVNGQFPDSHYLDVTGVVYEEIDQIYDLQKNVYLVTIDNSTNAIGVGAGRRFEGTGGRQGKSGGQALIPGALNPVVVAHELGHAFGLFHDFDDRTYIMSYGPGQNRLSTCHAGFLAVHPAFNPGSPLEFESKERLPAVQVVSPRAYLSGLESVTIQVEAGDSDGLHQVLLFGRTMTPHLAAGQIEVVACRGLAGKREKVVEFEYDGAIPSALRSSLSDHVVHRLRVTAVDREGDERTQSLVLAETSPHQAAILEAHESGVTSVGFSPRAPILATGSWDRTIKVWHTETFTQIAHLAGHKSGVNAVAFSPDGATLASGSSDKTIRIWDLATGTEVAALGGHEDGVHSVALTTNGDGLLLASGSRDGAVKLWDVQARKSTVTLEGHPEWVNSVSFSRNGAILASGSGDGTIILWDVESGDQTAVLRGHASSIGAVVISPDGAVVASGTQDGKVNLWDVMTREPIGTLEGHRAGVNAVSFSSGGDLLASGSRDGTVVLWNILTIEEIATFGYPGDVRSLSFASLGALLAAGGGGGGVRLWDVSKWTGSRPFALEIISGDGQRGAPGSALQRPFVVEVRDQYGEPLPNAAVTFTVTAGEGKLSGRFAVERAATDAAGRAQLTLTLGPHPGPNRVKVSFGGRELAMFHAQSVGAPTIGLEGDYRTWHLPNGATARLGKGVVGVGDRAVALSPDGRFLAVASAIGVWLYEAATSRAVALLPTERRVHAVAFSSEGALASGVENGLVELWDVENGTSAGTLEHEDRGRITAVAFSPDGKQLASGSWNQVLKVWDAETRGHVSTWKVPPDPRRGLSRLSVAFSPDGKRLASGFNDGTVRLWDVAARTEVALLTGHTAVVTSVVYSPDGALLASAGSWGDPTVRLWDVATETEVAVMSGHQSEVRSVAFSFPVGATLASGSGDGTVKLWDVAARTEAAALEFHTGAVHSVLFSGDGATLVSGGVDGRVMLSDVETGKARAVPGHYALSSAALSPGGVLVATGGQDGVVRLWDVKTQTPIAILGNHTHDVTALAFSQDSATLASGSFDRTVKLWDVSARQLIVTMERHDSLIFSVSFSGDGSTLASGDLKGRVQLWNVDTRERIETLDGHTNRVVSVSFSPDGTTLATGSQDGTVKLWNVSTRQQTGTLDGRSGSVLTVSFSSDGSALAVGSDRNVTLWDVATRMQIGNGTFDRRQSVPLSVNFMSNDKALITGHSDGTILLWDSQLLQRRQHTLAPASGVEQRRSAGVTLAEPFVVRLLDQYGNPVAGARVTFTVTAGGGTLSDTTVTTDEHGRAATTLTLGRKPGTNTVVATVKDVEPVTFTAIATARADFDGDGNVGFSDFLQFAGAFGLSQSDEGYDVKYDLDGNGAIGFSDFLIFAGEFGQGA